MYIEVTHQKRQVRLRLAYLVFYKLRNLIKRSFSNF